MKVTLQVFALASLFLAPLTWLGDSFRPGNEGGDPLSGPARTGQEIMASPPDADVHILRYLVAHEGTARFLVATSKIEEAIPFIFDTNAPVMAMGGYTGTDPILTPNDLAVLVRDHTVRYFLIPIGNWSEAEYASLYITPSITPASGSGSQTFHTHYTNDLTRWIGTTCTPIPPQRLGFPARQTAGVHQLFDCLPTG